MRVHNRIIILLTSLVLLSSASVFSSQSIVDVLYLCGNSWNIGGHRRDILMRADPSLEVDGVQTVAPYQIWDGTINPSEVNRKLRIYMPRNYAHMAEKYDLIVLHDVCHAHPLEAGVLFDRKWIHWMVRGLEEGDINLTMWGGDCCWGGQGEQRNPSWEETSLAPVLPFNSIGGYYPPTFIGIYMRPRFVDPEHPLNRLPWKNAPGIGVLNAVSVRPGANLVAEAVSNTASYPWISWWIWDQGRVVGETQVFSSLGAGEVMREEWEWWQDFVIYLAYFSVGKEIPDDVILAHRLRQEINLYITKKSMLVSVLEFVEKLGARTVTLYEELEDINGLKASAEEYYRDGKYDAAAETFEEMEMAWQGLDAKAIELKDNALTWIYAIEWLVVSAVSLASGVAIWTLMIGRRFYRGVGITRWD